MEAVEAVPSHVGADARRRRGFWEFAERPARFARAPSYGRCPWPLRSGRPPCVGGDPGRSSASESALRGFWGSPGSRPAVASGPSGGGDKKATRGWPCGFHGTGYARCICHAGQIQRYRGRVSGPLLDRIDLHVEAPALADRKLLGRARAESSKLWPNASPVPGTGSCAGSTTAAACTPTR